MINKAFQPLAERMRPSSLANYFGQKHLIGSGAVLRQMIDKGQIPSIIFWGPPGVGKTTLAEIIAHAVNVPFYTLSAINSGVKDVREVINSITQQDNSIFAGQGRAILFIDEIHRFSKSQQDSLLSAVERGIITLIGATTENPSFEVIRPLLSRCQVFTLNPLTDEDIKSLIKHAITTDEILNKKNITIEEWEALIRFAGGDARRALNIIDMIVSSEVENTIFITNELVRNRVQENPSAFDKGGEMHYDIASAFIKSIRGSDPDAALYWLARLIDGGEEPSFIARRLVISATEDIGLANPNALLIANACADALDRLGWPEGRIPLAQATVYLATSEKSNSTYLAIGRALEAVKQTGSLPVPMHLRNAPTDLMKDMGYGNGYKYAHDYPGHFVKQQYLPDRLIDEKFWAPDLSSTTERKIAERMIKIKESDN